MWIFLNLEFGIGFLWKLVYYNWFFREQNKKQWLQNIKSFQFIQADKRREDEKTARDTENKARRAMVNQMHDKAQVRPFYSCNKIIKGQLNSEWIYEVIISPKMPTENYQDFCAGSLSEGRAEVLVILGWHFGRNDDLINSFWI